VKNYGFSGKEPGWSDLIFARGQIYPGKGPKKSQRPNENFGARKGYLGPNL